MLLGCGSRGAFLAGSNGLSYFVYNCPNILITVNTSSWSATDRVCRTAKISKKIQTVRRSTNVSDVARSSIRSPTPASVNVAVASKAGRSHSSNFSPCTHGYSAAPSRTDAPFSNHRYRSRSRSGATGVQVAVTHGSALRHHSLSVQRKQRPPTTSTQTPSSGTIVHQLSSRWSSSKTVETGVTARRLVSGRSSAEVENGNAADDQ